MKKIMMMTDAGLDSIVSDEDSLMKETRTTIFHCCQTKAQTPHIIVEIILMLNHRCCCWNNDV